MKRIYILFIFSIILGGGCLFLTSNQAAMAVVNKENSVDTFIYHDNNKFFEYEGQERVVIEVERITYEQLPSAQGGRRSATACRQWPRNKIGRAHV